VLWTAIAALQRNEPNIISVVYTGDTDATKDEIIVKVKVCSVFPLLLHFIPSLDTLIYRLVLTLPCLHKHCISYLSYRGTWWKIRHGRNSRFWVRA
jgi:ALG11 mannosyltransferase N-terminus